MSLVLLGSTSGSVTLQEPAVAGSTVIDLPATSGTMAVTSGSPSFTNITATGTIKGASTISVGGATPAASGAGITFPAAISASSDANTLDDYEEGTWTPTVTAQVGSITTVTGQTGIYTKIGSRVIIEFYFNITSIGTATVAIGVSNLPFTPSVTNINYYTAPTRLRTGGLSENSEWDNGDAKIYIYTTPINSIYYGTMSYIV